MGLIDALEQLASAVAEVQRSALQDDKTPLRNATALAERIEQLAGDGDSHAVIFGDLNGFKLVNDMHGHVAGDAAIGKTGDLLSVILQGFDAEAFRQSGDEFVVVCSKAQLPDVGLTLTNTFKLAVFYHGGKKIELKMSFGWTTAANLTMQQCLGRAEAACRAAKQAGPGVILEWEAAHDSATDDVRSRCVPCGASFRVTPSSTTPCDKQHLWCPQCGHRA